MTKKPRSKRISCRKRYKILRKIREHHKKVKKIPKKLFVKKESGIPNSFPFKLEMIQKLKKDYENEKQTEKRCKSLSIDEFAHNAAEKLAQFDETMINKMEIDDENGIDNLQEKSLKFFKKDFRKVVADADIIIHVVDARDPLGTRSKKIEEEILSSGSNKKIILLLNKIDLIPRNVTLAWLKYFNDSVPTVAFKCGSQNKKENYFEKKFHKDGDYESNRKSLPSVGASSLLATIKNLSSSLNIIIGVVGYPNVGKSSVINSLRGANVCHVGSLPGITRTSQQIKLTGAITLIDSPGVIFPDKVDVPTPITIISTCITNQQIRSPLEAVKVLYTCCDHQNLREIFEIPSFENFESFIHNVAKRFGKLKKGGLPDLNSASKIILHYCSSGKMRYYLEPPIVNQAISAAIVSDFKPKFNLDPIFEEQIKVIQELTDEISYLKFDPNKAYQNLDPYCDIEMTRSIDNHTEPENSHKNAIKLSILKKQTSIGGSHKSKSVTFGKSKIGKKARKNENRFIQNANMDID